MVRQGPFSQDQASMSHHGGVGVGELGKGGVSPPKLNRNPGNIVQVPEYVLNVGRQIQLVVREVLHPRRVVPWIGNIPRTVQQVLTPSVRDRLPSLLVANRMSLEKIGT